MFIFSNLATSLDGKIASRDRGHFYLGTPADRKQMQVLRKKADAIVVGASTLRSFEQPMIVEGAKKHPLNVIISSTLEGIKTSSAFFKHEGIARLFFTGAETPPDRIRKFKKLADVVVLNPKKSIASQVVAELEKRKIKKLLVEGGGGVMWNFVEEGYIDEFHVTLTPWIIGGSQAPSLVDGKGFSHTHFQKLKLIRSKKIGDELYLTYQRK